MGDIDRDLVVEVHAHLAATEELPVDPEASRWLGEAQAVAADACDRDAPDPAVERRIAQVRDLLDHVDDTGNPAADEHVAAARELADRAVR